MNKFLNILCFIFIIGFPSHHAINASINNQSHAQNAQAACISQEHDVTNDQEKQSTAKSKNINALGQALNQEKTSRGTDKALTFRERFKKWAKKNARALAGFSAAGALALAYPFIHMHAKKSKRKLSEQRQAQLQEQDIIKDEKKPKESTYSFKQLAESIEVQEGNRWDIGGITNEKNKIGSIKYKDSENKLPIGEFIATMQKNVGSLKNQEETLGCLRLLEMILLAGTSPLAGNNVEWKEQRKADLGFYIGCVNILNKVGDELNNDNVSDECKLFFLSNASRIFHQGYKEIFWSSLASFKKPTMGEMFPYFYCKTDALEQEDPDYFLFIDGLSQLITHCLKFQCNTKVALHYQLLILKCVYACPNAIECSPSDKPILWSLNQRQKIYYSTLPILVQWVEKYREKPPYPLFFKHLLSFLFQYIKQSSVDFITQPPEKAAVAYLNNISKVVLLLLDKVKAGEEIDGYCDESRGYYTPRHSESSYFFSKLLGALNSVMIQIMTKKAMSFFLARDDYWYKKCFYHIEEYKKEVNNIFEYRIAGSSIQNLSILLNQKNELKELEKTLNAINEKISCSKEFSARCAALSLDTQFIEKTFLEKIAQDIKQAQKDYQDTNIIEEAKKLDLSLQKLMQQFAILVGATQ